MNGHDKLICDTKIRPGSVKQEVCHRSYWKVPVCSVVQCEDEWWEITEG